MKDYRLGVIDSLGRARNGRKFAGESGLGGAGNGLKGSVSSVSNTDSNTL